MATVFKDTYKVAKEANLIDPMVPTFVLWEKPGQTLIGRFMAAHQVPGKNEGTFYNQYVFFTDAGLIKCHLGGQADNEFGQFFRPGDVYMITFDGQEKLKGGNHVNKWKCEHIKLTTDELDALPGPKVYTPVNALSDQRPMDKINPAEDI